MKTVDFITAVNSGKRFRPIGSEYWHFLSKFGDVSVFKDEQNQYVQINKKFVNAQFELEEKSITITESEFMEAWGNSFGKNNATIGHKMYQLKKQLGFTE